MIGLLKTAAEFLKTNKNSLYFDLYHLVLYIKQNDSMHVLFESFLSGHFFSLTEEK